MKSKKIVITLGGTGGHVFPGVALAEQLSDIETLFIGGRLGQNRFFAESGSPFKEVSCGSMANIAKGIWQSGAALRKFQPDLVVGFGSYYTFPTLMAAKLLRIPIVLHEANAYPGKVHRLLSFFASFTGVHFPESAKYLRGNVVPIGMPLRSTMVPDPRKREGAMKYFGLEYGRKTILVFGGSQGAAGINRVVREAVPKEAQIIHITGDPHVTQPLRGIAKPYESRMELAWEVADLVISRSGAGTLAEMEAYGVPGILIPFPRSAENHQEKNADALVLRGYASKILEHNLTVESLKNAITKMLEEKKKAPTKHSHELSEAVRKFIKEKL